MFGGKAAFGRRGRRGLGLLLYAAGLLVFVELSLQAFYSFTVGERLGAREPPAVWAPNAFSGIFNRAFLDVRHRTREFDAAYYTDGAGLRVPAPGLTVARDKPPGVYRVMVLGPSFAFGWGVNYDQSFCARLQDLLARAPAAAGRRVEVVDAGVGSLPPAPHLEWYRNAGRDYRPDLVVQLVYGSLRVGNDPRPAVQADAEGHLVRGGHPRFAWLRARARRSATVFYAWLALARLRQALARDDAPREIAGAGRPLAEATHFDAASPREAESLSFYRDLAATVRAGGAEVLVVYFPLSFAVHPEDESRWALLGVRDVPGQAAYNAAFCGHLNAHGIACLDVSRDLRGAASGGRRLYYWLDVHWTPAGNDVVARAVAAHLAGR